MSSCEMRAKGVMSEMEKVEKGNKEDGRVVYDACRLSRPKLRVYTRRGAGKERGSESEV